MKISLLLLIGLNLFQLCSFSQKNKQGNNHPNAGNIVAQQPPGRIRFEHLNVADGLPENSVTVILQDHLGYMWLGTQNGLVRYDGTKMNVFQYDPKNPTSLKARNIRALHEDGHGDIWIGAENLYRFERATQTFIEYPNKNIAITGPSAAINFIHEDKRGNIWTITPNYNTHKTVLEKLDPSTNVRITYTATGTNPNQFADNGVFWNYYYYGFAEDNTGKIWITTAGDKENILHWFNPKTEKFVRYTPKLNSNQADDFKKIEGISFNKEDGLYVSTAGKGLFFLNTENGQVKQFKHDALNKNSLLNDTTATVYPVQNGFVWIPTFKGINRLDPATGIFKSYPSIPDDLSTPGGPLLKPYETPGGGIWFFTFDNHALNFYDPHGDSFTRYENNGKEEGGIAIEYGINCVFVDRTELVWVGSAGSGLFKQSRVNKFPLIPIDTSRSNSLQDVDVSAIYEAPSEPGVIWFGTKKGLDRYDKKTGTYTHYKHNDKNKNSISEGQVRSIVEDQKGRFWVGTAGGGLNLLDKKKGSFFHYMHDTANANSLISDYINVLHAGSDGQLWIGGYGLDRFDFDTKHFTHYVKGDTTYTPELFRLIGQFTSKDPHVAAILHPGDNTDKTIPFTLAESSEVLITGLGELGPERLDYGWVEDASGKIVWEMTTAKSVSDGSCDCSISARIQSAIIRMAAGSYRLRYKSNGSFAYGNWTRPPPYHPELWGIQLTKVSASESQLFNAEAIKLYYNGLGDNTIFCITEDREKNILIGSNNGGVTKFDPSTEKFTPFYDVVKGPNCVPGSIVEDNKAGNFWIGDYLMGLLFMNDKGEITRRFNFSNGLAGNSVYGIQRDTKGILWISTDNGLCRVDPVTEHIQLYTQRNGLQGLEFDRMSFGTTKDGEMYFGGAKGVNAFYPDQIKLDTIAPQVVLTDLFIAGKPATLGTHGQLPVDISMAKDITLPYNQSDLTFYFTTLLYSRGSESQFAYKLSPNDKDWINSGTIRQVRYTNLDPGTYTFTVKAANADGFWNEKGVSVTITILPPWWKTWWAYSLYFILLTGGIWYYIKNRERALKQRQKKLEQTVAKRTAEVVVQKERAEQSEKFKQQFLANMSHEIRTPMNAVMGMTNLVLDSPLNDKQKFYLKGIKKSSDALLHIINEILDLSKMEAGKMELEEIDFSVRDMLDQVKLLLQHKAGEKEIELITDIEITVPDVLIGDVVKLNQVLINLAGNAIKFTEKGSVTIEVRKGTKENNTLFSIIDTGIGIPKDKLQMVFESFSQAHSSDTRKFGGTGLGLTISKQLVKLMGGEITIQSEEGAGTIFSFEINYPVGSKDRMNEQQSVQQIDGSILNGLKILIVDDNEYNRIVVHDTLKSKASVEISQATNGQEAVELVEQNDFDVILMDVQMPVMDGYEATRYIREKFASPKNQTPVIALTASVIRSDLDKCRAAGMNDYIPKPFKVSHLFGAIAKAAGREISLVSLGTTGTKSIETKQETGTDSRVTDLSWLEKFCEGEKDRIIKYVKMFLSTAPALIDKVNEALANNDNEEIASQIHGFKTKFIMMGMNNAKELALKIEKQCHEEKDVNGARENITTLLNQVEKAINELK